MAYLPGADILLTLISAAVGKSTPLDGPDFTQSFNDDSEVLNIVVIDH
jgi:hypothetical protein